MTAPAVHVTATETHRGQQETRNLNQLIVAAHALDLGMSAAKIAKSARRWSRDRLLQVTPFERWIANVAACPAESMPHGRGELVADPTGETAVRNVMEAVHA